MRGRKKKRWMPCWVGRARCSRRRGREGRREEKVSFEAVVDLPFVRSLPTLATRRFRPLLIGSVEFRHDSRNKISSEKVSRARPAVVERRTTFSSISFSPLPFLFAFAFLEGIESEINYTCRDGTPELQSRIEEALFERRVHPRVALPPSP